MLRFCELTESATNEPIHINPTLVRFIRSVSSDHTQIVFDEEHSLGVTESIAVVRQALDDADRTERHQAQIRRDWRNSKFVLNTSEEFPGIFYQRLTVVAMLHDEPARLLAATPDFTTR